MSEHESRGTVPAPQPATGQQSLPSLAQRIRARFGEGVDPAVSLKTAGRQTDASSSSSRVLTRLAHRPVSSGRYRIQDEVGHGGMGAVLRVWDEDLRRNLAMKVILGKGPSTTQRSPAPAPGPEAGAATPVTDDTLEVAPQQVARFLEEAQVTGQLDHPGIVPVHELGLDDEGHVYFTMKLVKGEDLKGVFVRVHAGEPEWSVTRVLGILQRVCEAMAFAHDKGVIHRDLKPANIMVGRYGEVYVMDWGLARVLGESDRKDLRLRPDPDPSVATVRSERRSGAGSDSPLMTMDGDVLGTPAYMPPEQALGQLDSMGPGADVYAVGAMLYHLLAGCMPYTTPGGRRSARAILAQVQSGPPSPVHTLAPHAPAELVAICERAMARERSARYAGMLELADDLRAFLEGRVVRAYETGAVAELRKWVVRNKSLAASLAVLLLLLFAGTVVFAALNADLEDALLGKEDQRQLALANADQAQLNAERAQKNALASEAAAAEARREKANVLRLSAFRDLQQLEQESQDLWPATPDRLPAYDNWLSRAAALVAGLHPSADGSDPGHLAQREALRGRSASEDMWWSEQLSRLIEGIERFSDPRTGLVAGISLQAGWGVRSRRDFAALVGERTISGDAARARWATAIASIADREQCPQHDGLALAPQMGLLPIGRDPNSGLWEFWHVQSGDEPRRGPDGKLVLDSAMGVVLVLIPGGTFWMGASAKPEATRNRDPMANTWEEPVHQVTLSPFLLSKFEFTQTQWDRATGTNPSGYGPNNYYPDWNESGLGWSGLHPVERVSWDDCIAVARSMGLRLPSEAQWEYANRAGTSTVFWTGDTEASLQGAANVVDVYAVANGYELLGEWTPVINDGHSAHARVGSYRANAFGLHDTHGNVIEWCQDGSDEYTEGPAVDPLNDPEGARGRVSRGGCFLGKVALVRSSFRNGDAPELRVDFIGMRPGRAIDPP